VLAKRLKVNRQAEERSDLLSALLS